MFIVGLFSWWYGAGWKHCALAVRDNLHSVFDYFSIDLLLKTLFSPWRQISAGKVRGNIEMQMRALFDNLISRMIGSVIRCVVVIFGLMSIVVTCLIGVVRLVLWPLVPIMPMVFVLFAVAGWVPWRI